MKPSDPIARIWRIIIMPNGKCMVFGRDKEEVPSLCGPWEALEAKVRAASDWETAFLDMRGYS